MGKARVKKHPFRVEEHTNQMYLVSRGRTALLCAIDLLSLSKERQILLPGYIGIDKEGSGVYDPVATREVGFEFYKLNYDLSIDMDDFQEKIRKPDIKAALVIYYFGFVAFDLEQVVRLCRETDTRLIEDCAHALMSKHDNRYLGESGDISFFSLHKSLPIADGGLLVINNRELGSPCTASYPISEESLRLLYHFDLSEISRIRRRNYILLSEKIDGVHNLRLLYPELPEGVVPLNLPVMIDNINRDQVHFGLLDKGTETTAMYHWMIEQIDRKQFPVSSYISDHILNLPIHQDITEEDIEYMARSLKEVIESQS